MKSIYPVVLRPPVGLLVVVGPQFLPDVVVRGTALLREEGVKAIICGGYEHLPACAALQLPSRLLHHLLHVVNGVVVLERGGRWSILEGVRRCGSIISALYGRTAWKPTFARRSKSSTPAMLKSSASMRAFWANEKQPPRQPASSL
jgi:hypothetical protein